MEKGQLSLLTWSKIHVFIKNTLLIALFDSGATHSFISINCVKKLNLPFSSLPFDLSVSTPTGRKVSTSQTYLNCPILIEGKPFVIDLVCLPLTDIDIIIGMDWLSSNDIILDCSRKLTCFPIIHSIDKSLLIPYSLMPSK